MNKTNKKGNAKVWTLLLAAAVVLCLGGMAFSLVSIQSSTGDESVYRMAADEMRKLSREIADTARATTTGQESDFADLSALVSRFETSMFMLDAVELQQEADQVVLAWEQVREASQVLVDAGPRIVYINEVSQELAGTVPQMQAELDKVVDINGVKVVGRSFKYHRRRGIFGAHRLRKAHPPEQQQ